ncbi:GntR family transcriptional regulator [Streptomyces sp. NPDC002055]|uniref:GntR family transcriptional regulator n=1 Tax=Streptomyces sp. NPDC002055 TaxID=3154534 RepID=UPI003326DC88
MPETSPESPGPRTTDRAYAEVRARLLDGSYRPGELLHEDTVATELGLPGEAVHDAFTRLREEGALRLYPTRGALVLPATLQEARDVMEARLLLEIFALDSVAARSRTELRELGRELLSEIHEVGTPDEAMAVGRAFHTRLVRAAGNPVVADMHVALWDRTWHIAASSTVGPGNPENDAAEHAAIAEAMAIGRGGDARGLLHQHVSATLHRIGVVEEFALPRPADLSG